ncbi:succinylglutamate desuccinylase/aspartoacylase family protein [Kordiimonas sp. SCSIO 12610]|uniref:succinylglutamate desuccinylase/aspartoacylase family protein n=1 Tax=Kordiimonas sp. SCSIO 12610 TaxID=2829597 RepID=UPI00210DE4B1|nr:succinylglutamate desuccinylase/aspartoacylase family protein [Kordiimonas sp. SCSIO 12610]UTW55171.1 succinylglutamate desuccinylase/aspartoacylase family protein [Kordiimonas sp. SCSIO 12610]
MAIEKIISSNWFNMIRSRDFLVKSIITVSLCLCFVISPVFAVDEQQIAAKYIDSLNTTALKQGRHHFYVKVSSDNLGMPVRIPLIVLKGTQPGKTILLTAGIHGDELNGIRVIHQLLEQLNYRDLKGTIIALPGINQSGINANSRYFVSSSGGGFQSDLNRLFPGTKQNGNAASLYVNRVWANVIKGRADIAIDLHTQTRGTVYPLFVFADFRNKEAKQIADLLMPDVIKNDVGEKGTLETSLVRAGVPAVTFEIGAPKRFQKKLISRAVAGIKNVMQHYEMLEGERLQTNTPPIVGSGYKNIYAEQGGIVVVHKHLMDKVQKGDLVATQYDAFGQIKKEYFSPVNGHILSHATDPVREPGAMLVRIIY